MLLNKIPALDKGYVALIDVCMGQSMMDAVRDEFFGAQEHRDAHRLSYMTLAIKCPLFLNVYFSTYGLDMLRTIPDKAIECYLPDVGDIAAPNAYDGQSIAEDIKRTSDILMVNQKAYKADGCDHFTSQVLMPISTYTTMLVGGKYKEWERFCAQANLPKQIEAYRRAVEQIITNEWRT